MKIVKVSDGKRAEIISQFISAGYKFATVRLTIDPGKYRFLTSDEEYVYAVRTSNPPRNYLLPIIAGTLISAKNGNEKEYTLDNSTDLFYVSYDQFIMMRPGQRYSVVINEESYIESIGDDWFLDEEPYDDDFQDSLDDNNPRNTVEGLISEENYDHQNLPATKVPVNVENIGANSNLVDTLDDVIEKQAQWAKLSKSVLFEIDNFNKESSAMGVYVIHCQRDDNFYIGSTINLLKRKKQHLHNLNRKKHHSYKLQDTFDKYGCDCLKFYSLELDPILPYLLENKTENELHTYLLKNLKYEEQCYIDEFSPFFNVEQDSKGSRHWEGNSKYISWRLSSPRRFIY